MTLTVSVVDDYDPTAPADVVKVQEGDYLLITVDPCVESSIQVYGGGRTHVITIRNRIVR